MSQRRSARIIVALVAAVLLPWGSGAGAGAVASPAAARADDFGSAGGGDAYFPADGNGGYDVTHYSIRDRYRFRSRLLTGTTVVRARATQRLTRFHLDLLLGARSVTVNGVPAHFGKPTPHELRVIPAAPIEAGQDFTVTVSYLGYPGRKGYLGERNFLANGSEAAAVNQPHMAPWWFAANDHPRDKARFDITVIVPSGKQVLSNGRLVQRRRTGATTAFHWRSRDPMAPYQAFFVAGDFIVDSGYANGLAYKNAVSKHLPKAEIWRSRRQLLRSTALVRWLQKQLGAYPFEVIGGVRTSLDLGFSLENQTRPVYGGPIGTRLLIHELAHQWLGNSVGLERWRDIWLNEGMASWMEWRYEEARGLQNPQTRLLRAWAQAPAATWTLPIGDPGPANIFDAAVYDRGAMTVQALRHRLGETDFWLVLKGWVALNRHGTATTEDLKSLVWQISGRDLTSFWEAWLFTPERPARTAANGLA